MQYPIHKLTIGAALALAMVATSCRQPVNDIEGMAEKGFFVAPRQAYFELSRQTVQLGSFPYGVASLTPSGITVSSGELTADSTYVRVDVPVCLAGPKSSTPLEVKVKVGTPVDYSGSASVGLVPQVATSGVDFEPLLSSYAIPADSVRMTIPVLFRRSSVSQADEAGKELILELEATSDLQLRFTDATRYRIRVIDALQEPGWWIGFSNAPGGMGFLGDYSRAKYQYLLAKLPILATFKGALTGDAYKPVNITAIAVAALEIAQEHPELGLSEAQIRRFLP